MDALQAQQGLNSTQQLMFQSEYANAQKNSTIAILLAFFIGGLGGHRFYMGQVGLGVVYCLFSWTFIPSIIAFIELFLLSGRVKRYNENKAVEIASRIKALA